ncbi:septation protein SepH [Kocuria sp.]|uniref:septation protein SepH n=1 Tax=Kocuria sp. TaxID=1871328 RepID=UPI0026DB528C|nr:septation protein SepH [Kocuria sp.]MDO4919791.1 septation protein SepH [Kocuria sp.]
MEQLRLVGVHDDGESLIVETPDSTRYRLPIDQQLRQSIQHARRKPPARGRGGASYGPRDIQARFRAGATVEEVVAESGWEADRVRRYEWPILAERSHVVAEACRVKVTGTNPVHDGYRSVFEGDPKSLEETVAERAPQVGVDRATFDWDAWLREDQLWSIQLTFIVTDPGATGTTEDGPALWSYNPATQSLRPENGWARTLGEEPRETGPLGTAAPAAPAVAPSPQLRQLQQEASQADDLLDVLQARRGRRLGADEAADDRLAEILGRGMGQVERRPRPIDAPEDSAVFDRPIQPAASRVAEDRALQEEGIEIVDDSTPLRQDPPVADTGGDTAAAPRPVPPENVHEDAPEAWVDVTTEDPRGTATPEGPEDHARARGQDAPSAGGSPVMELHARGSAGQDTASPAHTSGAALTADARHGDADRAAHDSHGNQAHDPRHSSPDAEGGEAEQDSARSDDAGATPGPRGRTPKAKRSSVPSWDDIVFGANRE